MYSQAQLEEGKELHMLSYPLHPLFMLYLCIITSCCGFAGFEVVQLSLSILALKIND